LELDLRFLVFQIRNIGTQEELQSSNRLRKKSISPTSYAFGLVTSKKQEFGIGKNPHEFHMRWISKVTVNDIHGLDMNLGCGVYLDFAKHIFACFQDLGTRKFKKTEVMNEKRFQEFQDMRNCKSRSKRIHGLDLDLDLNLVRTLDLQTMSSAVYTHAQNYEVQTNFTKTLFYTLL